MIEVKNLFLSLGGREVLNNISFTVAKGDKVALVGANGTGKTTLLRVLAGEIFPDSGRVRLIGWPKIKIGYMPQYFSGDELTQDADVIYFLMESRGLKTIESKLKQIELKLSGEKLSGNDNLLQEYQDLQEDYIELGGYNAPGDIQRILAGVGLDGVDAGTNVKCLSGGQKSRLAIAKLLYEDSDILLLDEPTNHLDVDASMWLANYLAETPKTVLVVSHLPDFLDRFATRVLLLEGLGGNLKSYHGNYSQYYRAWSSEKLTADRERTKILTEIDRLKRFIDSAPQSKARMKHDREKVVRRLEEGLPGSGPSKATLKVNFTVSKPLRGTIVAVREISKSFGRQKIFSGISFGLKASEKLGIIGDNGAGKTTLLRILSDELKPDHGKVWRDQKLKIGWYQQEQEGLHDDLTVLAEVKTVANHLSISILRSALAHFLFSGDRINQQVGTLSRGERNRLVMCKLVVAGSNLLMLDEPTNHLDRQSREKVKIALASYAGAIVIVSHDREFMTDIGVKWVICLPEGKMARLDTFIHERR